MSGHATYPTVDVWPVLSFFATVFNKSISGGVCLQTGRQDRRCTKMYNM